MVSRALTQHLGKCCRTGHEGGRKGAPGGGTWLGKAWRREAWGGTQKKGTWLMLGMESVKRLSAVPSICMVKQARDHATELPQLISCAPHITSL